MSKESYDGINLYMKEISGPLLTRKEEIECAALIAAGSEEAREKMIKANLRLVVKIAHDFKSREGRRHNLTMMDLVSEGNIGLMRAVEKFDPEKGAKMSSYSAWWIKQEMRRAIAEKSRAVRVPIASAGKISKVKRAFSDLRKKLGRNPTDEEISKHTDISIRSIRAYQSVCWDEKSLQDKISEGEEDTYEQFLGDDCPNAFDYLKSSDDIYLLRKGFERLSKRERDILIMRYGLDGSRPKTLKETSEHIGRTREGVRLIQLQARKKLRKFITNPPEDLEKLVLAVDSNYVASPCEEYGTTPCEEGGVYINLREIIFELCDLYDMVPEEVEEVLSPYLVNSGNKKNPIYQYEETSLDALHMCLSAEKILRQSAEILNSEITVEVYDA